MAFDAAPVFEFEAHRDHLRAVAYRILGSASEADDAIQEAWLRYSRTDTAEVGNIGGWLTTVVARVCLNMLRTRRSRHEEPIDAAADAGRAFADAEADPAGEAVLVDAVGRALLVVLDRLAPVERVAFVLHDMFAVPFDQIAELIERTPEAARQLASRARRRVQGREATPDHVRQRQVVEAFLAASRGGDFEALVAVLDPDVVFEADRFVAGTPGPVRLDGAAKVAGGARLAGARAAVAALALVDGRVGMVVAPGGRLALVLAFTVRDGRVAAFEVVGDPERLAAMEIELLAG